TILITIKVLLSFSEKDNYKFFNLDIVNVNKGFN
ncbi:unnamed protein product, partial [marine sediment metagenome]